MEHFPKLVAKEMGEAASQGEIQDFRELARQFAQDIGKRFEELLKAKNKL